MARDLDDNRLNQSMEDATVAIINADPELRDDLRGLMKEIVARYTHVIRYGAPADRLAAMKAAMPGMIRAMGRVEQSMAEKMMREAYDRLLAGDDAP